MLFNFITDGFRKLVEARREQLYPVPRLHNLTARCSLRALGQM